MQEDYDNFKRTALVCATIRYSAKEGAIICIVCETESDVYLPNLTQYITFAKEQKNTISVACGNY